MLDPDFHRDGNTDCFVAEFILSEANMLLAMADEMKGRGIKGEGVVYNSSYNAIIEAKPG